MRVSVGTDITTRLEVRYDGRWRLAGDGPWGSNDRSYRLFAVLADVCNRVGPGVVISPPRGLPDDVSAGTMQDVIIEEGFFGHSWLGVDELLAFDRAAAGRVAPGAELQLAEPPPRTTLGEVSLADWLPMCWAEGLARLAYRRNQLLVEPADLRVIMWFDN